MSVGVAGRYGGAAPSAVVVARAAPGGDVLGAVAIRGTPRAPANTPPPRDTWRRASQTPDPPGSATRRRRRPRGQH